MNTRSTARLGATLMTYPKSVLRPSVVGFVLVSCLACGVPVRALPAWTSQDDLSFVDSFATAFYGKTGSVPSPDLVQASLNCARTAYAQAAATGADLPSAIRAIVSVCQNGGDRSRAPGRTAGTGSGTLFNSSGDASLSSDSNGCMDYSSGPYSFSNC